MMKPRNSIPSRTKASRSRQSSKNVLPSLRSALKQFDRDREEALDQITELRQHIIQSHGVSTLEMMEILEKWQGTLSGIEQCIALTTAAEKRELARARETIGHNMAADGLSEEQIRVVTAELEAGCKGVGVDVETAEPSTTDAATSPIQLDADEKLVWFGRKQEEEEPGKRLFVVEERSLPMGEEFEKWEILAGGRFGWSFFSGS